MVGGGGRSVCVRCAVCLWLSRGEPCAGCGAVLSAPEGCTVVVESGACSFEQDVFGVRVDAREGVVCWRLYWWTAASVALFPWFPSLSAGVVVVLRLCDSSERGAQMSTDLRHRPIGVA
eukprot:scaffold6140_cov114-Isochrysis_galbana.AAC.1